MPDTHKTSRLNFAYFKERCHYWIDRLGLRGWDWIILHEGDEGHRGTLAWFASNREARSVKIRLSRTWPMNPTKEELDKTARHEVIEAGLFYELKEMANDDFAYRRSEIDGVVHAAIHRIEHLIKGSD